MNNNKKNMTQQGLQSEDKRKQRQPQQAWQEAQTQTVQNTAPPSAQQTTANQTSVQQPNTVQQKPTQQNNAQNQEPNHGYSYDNKTDYQGLIDAATAAGNYQLAAIYEQQRNAKIAGEGLEYEQTSNYSSYLPNTEGAPPQQNKTEGAQPQQNQNDLTNLITQMYDQEAQRIRTEMNYEVQRAADQLNRALQDAQPTYEAALANQLLEAKQAQDAQALRNQINGDRGGIGSAQVASIGNTGAKNREAIAQQQRQLATDTARQIADLRAQGKYQEANLLLQNSQQKLSALYEEQVRMQQEAAAQKEFLSSIGLQYLQAGKMPPDNLLGAMGIDRQTAQGYADLIREQLAASQTQKDGSGGYYAESYNADDTVDDTEQDDVEYGVGMAPQLFRDFMTGLDNIVAQHSKDVAAGKAGDTDPMTYIWAQFEKWAPLMSKEQWEEASQWLYSHGG